MLEIPIVAQPNQEFSIEIGSNLYDFSIKLIVQCLAISISRNNISLISNFRILGNQPILPYRFLYDGNFFLNTENNEIAIWSELGISQKLYYLSNNEISSITQ